MYTPNDTPILQLWSFLLVTWPFFVGTFSIILILWLSAVIGTKKYNKGGKKNV